MKKYVKTCLLILLIATISISSGAMIIPLNEKAKEKSKAPAKSPVINENWELERIDFIHYAKPQRKTKGKREVCYKLLRAKWGNLPINYVINPLNSFGLDKDFITNAIFNAAETWDSATTNELFSDSFGLDENAKYGIQDFKNSIVFDEYPDENVIAITTIWYIPKRREIVEFDMLFNTKYKWGDATQDSSLMDLINIATHGFGHSVGLDDVYSDSCSEVTMYGYSSYGEVKKRTLEKADIEGLHKIYKA